MTNNIATYLCSYSLMKLQQTFFLAFVEHIELITRIRTSCILLITFEIIFNLFFLTYIHFSYQIIVTRRTDNFGNIYYTFNLCLDAEQAFHGWSYRRMVLARFRFLLKRRFLRPCKIIFFLEIHYEIGIRIYVRGKA